MSNSDDPIVPRWKRFEARFESQVLHEFPFQEVQMDVTFLGPKDSVRKVSAFWDGGRVWRVRFSPDTEGEWSYTTVCSLADDRGLHGQSGGFVCGSPMGGTRFNRHGPVRLASNHRYLEHCDGTPFLWIGDTAWNGPLLSSPGDWDVYLKERAGQKFTVVQWVTTAWLASPKGDANAAKAFYGVDCIDIEPVFFQRLDAKADALEEAGLLSVPVLLWAAEWSTPEANALNPGIYLPIDQAILLAKYMVARWGANPVVWILAGDGNYCGEKAERWRRIGRAVFGDEQHSPVILHPAGMQSNLAEFQRESWLDILGYQSGHGDDSETVRWLVSGPPAADWRRGPPRPIINLEPPYEDHVAHHSQTRINADFVRRALYWSMLVCPTAGVTYGAHGVWAWDDGLHLTEGHPNAGWPQPWQVALKFIGAQQVAHLAEIFSAIEWWTLRPASELLVNQSAQNEPERFIASACSSDGLLGVIYIPDVRSVEVRPPGFSRVHNATWFNPRNGEKKSVGERIGNHFTTPNEGDWVLVIYFDYQA